MMAYWVAYLDMHLRAHLDATVGQGQERGDCCVGSRQELQRGASGRGIMASAPLEPHVPDVARNLR
ncbi:hypothetical protein DMX07_09055 [Pseudomonas soli]|uniref:Uncharacterized protein n=1 Tax=Pseudomonas soli TaxID=1306993 RepID=A0A2V4I9S6_9PSED|nr:hypothetical protein DMX07_09055 [Pseudomonas soli]